MKLINTKISGLKIIKTKIYKDRRGYLKEVFKSNLFKKKDFVFDVMSFKKKNTLRGLHIQLKNPQSKTFSKHLRREYFEKSPAGIS